jgi:hypothetical protein
MLTKKAEMKENIIKGNLASTDSTADAKADGEKYTEADAEADELLQEAAPFVKAVAMGDKALIHEQVKLKLALGEWNRLFKKFTEEKAKTKKEGGACEMPGDLMTQFEVVRELMAAVKKQTTQLAGDEVDDKENPIMVAKEKMKERTKGVYTNLRNEIKKKLAGGDSALAAPAGLSDAFHTFSAEPDKAELQQEAQWELKKAMTYLEEMDVWTNAFLLANQKCASRPVSNLSAPCVSSERNATMILFERAHAYSCPALMM